MKDVFFSILIPNLGINKNISKCFDSACNQLTNNLFEYEIILCDQTDGIEGNEIKRFVTEKYNKIKYIYSEIKSLYKSRILLYKNSSGKYIVFLDSDDYLENDYLLKIYNSLLMNNLPDVLIHNFKIYKNNKILNGVKLTSFCDICDLFDFFIFTNKINSACRKVFKNHLVNENDFYSGNINNTEDKFFSFPFMKASKKIVNDDSIDGYIYCLNNNSMSRKFDINEACFILNSMSTFIENPSLNSKQKQLMITALIECVRDSNSVLKMQRILNKKNFTILCDEFINICEKYNLHKVDLKVKKYKFLYTIYSKKIYIATWFLK